MNTGASRLLWLMFCGVLFAVVWCAFVFWTPSNIQRHRMFIKDWRSNYAKPTKVSELFSGQALGWLRQQGTTASRRAELGKEHEDALIRLGYFERRSFNFTNIDTTTFFQTLFSAPLHDPLCYFQFGNVADGVLEVVAHTNDFERIARLLREHEKKK